MVTQPVVVIRKQELDSFSHYVLARLQYGNSAGASFLQPI